MGAQLGELRVCPSGGKDPRPAGGKARAYGPMAVDVARSMPVRRGSPELFRIQHRLSRHRGRQVERREARAVRDPGSGETIHRPGKCVSRHPLGGAGPKSEDFRAEMRRSLERPVGSQNIWSVRAECRGDLQQDGPRRLGKALGCLRSHQVKAVKPAGSRLLSGMRWSNSSFAPALP